MSDVLRCARCNEAVRYVRADNGVCAVCDLRDSLKAARAEIAEIAAERDMYRDELAQLRQALQDGIEEMLALQQNAQDPDE
jgi:cell division protein FtsB